MIQPPVVQALLDKDMQEEPVITGRLARVLAVAAVQAVLVGTQQHLLENTALAASEYRHRFQEALLITAGAVVAVAIVEHLKLRLLAVVVLEEIQPALLVLQIPVVVVAETEGQAAQASLSFAMPAQRNAQWAVSLQ